jgi:hypothetical protein
LCGNVLKIFHRKEKFVVIVQVTFYHKERKGFAENSQSIFNTFYFVLTVKKIPTHLNAISIGFLLPHF